MTMPPGPPDTTGSEPDAWPGSGPPPPTWGAGEPAATSDAAAFASGTVAPSDRGGATPDVGPTGAHAAPPTGSRRVVVIAAAVVIVALVAGLVVWLVRRSDDSTKATAASSTTVGGVTSTSSAATLLDQLHFASFTSTNPTFSMVTPGAARRDPTTRTARFGPAIGATARWTLDVRPAAPGANLDQVIAKLAIARGGRVATAANSGVGGVHTDATVIGKGGVVYHVHVASGTDNLFILTVPAASGGSLLVGRAIFSQMTTSLKANGVGG